MKNEKNTARTKIDDLLLIARKQFSEKNDSGEGFAVGAEGQTVEEAIAQEGWVLLWERWTDDSLSLAQRADGSYVAVGDAGGPWAVDIDLEADE